MEKQNTEKERQRADDAIKRTAVLEAEVKRLQALLK